MTHNTIKAKLIAETEALGLFQSCFACTYDKCTAHKYNHKDRLDFLSRTYDEIARAERTRIAMLMLQRDNEIARAYDAADETVKKEFLQAILAEFEDSQLAEHFGETKSVDNCA